MFVGANDGASGTALLMELGHQMADLKGKLGVDFVLFDGEEFIFRGAPRPLLHRLRVLRHGLRQRTAATYRYRWAVLLDMVGDADLQIYPDRHSMSWDDTRPLVDAIWDTAARLGVREFVVDKRYDVLDDHMKLHDIGKIPCCDIIDFNYPAWHTQADTPRAARRCRWPKSAGSCKNGCKQAVRESRRR